MNQEEKKFVESIEKKIKFYRIKTTFDDAIETANDVFTETQYSDGTTELIDTGIERHLCKMSPYYFIHRYAWISLPNVGIIPFNLYYFQRSILRDLLEFQKVVCEKVRQCGLSTLFSMYCLWKLNFREAEDIDVVSLKQLKAQAFVAKMDSTLKYLPPFLKTRIIKDNEQVLQFENGSKIISESQSENAGRSDTLSLLVLDEAAHYKSEKMVRGIVAAAQPTLSRTNGQFIILSTPNKTSGPGAYYYEQVQQAKMESENNTRLVSVDWWEVPDAVEIDGPKKGYSQILERFVERDYYYNPEVKREAKKFFDPIGENNWRENPWLKKQHDDLGEILYKQEVLHNFIVGGNAVFNEDILKKVEGRIKDPITQGRINNVRMDNVWVWGNPLRGHRYIMGVDIASGTGAETSSFQILDVETYEQVCEYKGMIATKNFGMMVKAVANYYNQAFVVIECNGIGEAVFNEVYYHDTEPYQNVFKQTKTKNNITRMTGWITDTKTRKLLTNEFIDWFTVDGLFSELKMYSKRVYMEMATWIWDGTKPVHDSGSTDDTIMAFALALYLRHKASNAGESFMINEKGEFIEYSESKDKVVNEEDQKNKFEFVSSDEKEGNSEDIFFKGKYGIGKEEYLWLIGKR
jgi:hypothetical protein